MQKSKALRMRAASQNGPGGDLEIIEVDIPKPGKGEVLVKMAYAPLNPSDLSQLQGTFTPLPDYPFTPGIEGSGTVVEAGKGLIPSMRMNKRVACSAKKGYGGTWAEYMLTDATKCIPLKKELSLEQGAMLLVNPMTALAFIDIARKGGHSAIVNNAASSSLGIMLIKLCKRHNIKLINIVRREEQVEDLKNLGAEYILNSSLDIFRHDLEHLCSSLDAKLFFDAVGGEQTALMAEAAPANSTIFLYAMLSETPFTIDSRAILQHGKRIEGFSLPLWTAGKSIISLLRMTGQVQKLLNSDLGSKLRKTYPLDEINQALTDYKSGMSGGKLLIKA